MHILLINNNPVVSRLLKLCTRDGDMVLEEVEGVEKMQQDRYDVVFIDEGSYIGDVLNLSELIDVSTKVLLSNADVEINDFDMTVKKPFLPSQIIEILEQAKQSKEVAEETTEFPLNEDKLETKEMQTKEDISSQEVLDGNEIEKIKALLEMDDEEVPEDDLSQVGYEARKIELIKEQLIAEGLEIVGEEEIVEELSSKSEDATIVTVFSNEEEDEAGKKSKKKSSKKRKKQKKKKDSVFTQEDLEQIEDAVQIAIATLKRKQMKKLLKGKEIAVTIKLEGND